MKWLYEYLVSYINQSIYVLVFNKKSVLTSSGLFFMQCQKFISIHMVLVWDWKDSIPNAQS